MLKHWTSYADYKHFIESAVLSMNQSELKRFHSYNHSLFKLLSLNLDILKDILLLYYSNTGRPSKNQPEIFRSFILMADMSETSITKWVKALQSDDILATLIGCSPHNLPSLGSYYDFIDRLWLYNDSYEYKKLYPSNKNFKPKKKLKNGSKLKNKNVSITKRLFEFMKDGRTFSARFERLLQEIFVAVAVSPSFDLGLLDEDNLTIAGDGSSLHIHASHNGNKHCSCRSTGIYRCNCPRTFSDPDASIGWDSDLNTWYYGHTLYTISSYNKALKIDLPLHISIFNAKRHDSVSGIVALAEIKQLLPKARFKNACFDSANDNIPTYLLCKHWNITPFIDFNKRNTIYKKDISISPNGTPICKSGMPMVHWGFCPDRQRHKWRCPKVARKKISCDFSCSDSDYGRTFYTYCKDNPRLFPPVRRDSTKFKRIYATRTACERINNRILNDYKIHQNFARGRKRISFFSIIAGINIHLDARVKVQSIN